MVWPVNQFDKSSKLSYNICMRERNSSVDDTLTKWRSAIIADILQNGLKSNETLTKEGRKYLGSNDKESSSLVEGVVISPPAYFSDIRLFFKDLHSALYQDGHAVLPVISERPGEKILSGDMEMIKNKLSRRIVSSFLIVCNYNPLARTLYEDSVKSNQFSYLIFPDLICNETYLILLLQRTSEERKIPVKVAKGTVKRDIVNQYQGFLAIKDIEVPDYEKVIMDTLWKSWDPIWVHGVRLPINEDLQLDHMEGGIA